MAPTVLLLLGATVARAADLLPDRNRKCHLLKPIVSLQKRSVLFSVEGPLTWEMTRGLRVYVLRTQTLETCWILRKQK